MGNCVALFFLRIIMDNIDNKKEKIKEDQPHISFNEELQEHFGIIGKENPVFRISKVLDPSRKSTQSLLNTPSFKDELMGMMDECVKNGYPPNEFKYFFNKRNPEGQKTQYLIEILVFKD